MKHDEAAATLIRALKSRARRSEPDAWLLERGRVMRPPSSWTRSIFF